ncbi:hypothetical protein QUA81_00630 [Microcoleus sp. F6_B4]
MAVEDRIQAIFVRRIIFWGAGSRPPSQQLQKIHSVEIFALYLLLSGNPALELVDI